MTIHPREIFDGALVSQPPCRHAQRHRCGPDRPEPGHAPGGRSAARTELGDDVGVHRDLQHRPALDGALLLAPTVIWAIRTLRTPPSGAPGPLTDATTDLIPATA